MSLIKIDENTCRKFLNHSPALLLTGTDGKRHNISTVSWWSLVQDLPLCVSVSLHYKSYNYEIAKKSNYIGMNILSSEYEHYYKKFGEISGYRVNKFKKFELQYKYFQNSNIPYLLEALVVFKGKKLNEFPMKRFEVFIYEIDDSYVKSELLKNNGDVNWRIYKTLHYVNDIDYFTPNFW